jgi:hypothetical protein
VVFTENNGHGIVALEDIEAGKTISFYGGTILRKDSEEVARLKQSPESGFLFELSNGEIFYDGRVRETPDNLVSIESYIRRGQVAQFAAKSSNPNSVLVQSEKGRPSKRAPEAEMFYNPAMGRLSSVIPVKLVSTKFIPKGEAIVYKPQFMEGATTE